MVADALIYHPTVAHYLRYVASTGEFPSPFSYTCFFSVTVATPKCARYMSAFPCLGGEKNKVVSLFLFFLLLCFLSAPNSQSFLYPA
jgi:hypothetical protein